jgi:hypothetical protein
MCGEIGQELQWVERTTVAMARMALVRPVKDLPIGL